ncbi:MAG: alkaline phosphatase D family protein [Adhaeribacter sp.]
MEENKIAKDKDPVLNNLSRRSFLQKTTRGAGLLGGIGLLGPMSLLTASPAEALAAETATSNAALYPFKLGVASGDPLPKGVVLWTKLAPNPLVPGGGMAQETVSVSWEVSKDETFRKIVKKGIEKASPALGHSVHVEVEGLKPNTRYYYRFKTADAVSPVGRTKTAPRRKANVKEVKFAFLSCQNIPSGFFTPYEHLVKEDLDVVFFLGDYIYESKGDVSEAGRFHVPSKVIVTLDDYRIRYGQYKSDPALQAAHAAFPWMVTLDDHEIVNNWGGEDPSNSAFMARRAAAFQAFYEHMPMRKSAMPDSINMLVYRKFAYGKLMEVNILDTRQYRSVPNCQNAAQSPCPDRVDLSRTIMGLEQEKWLFNNLETSKARWNVLAQQVLIVQKDDKEGPAKGFGSDRWDGFVASRNRLFDAIRKNNLSNVVVLTGDTHQNWVNDLKDDFDKPDSATIATEFGCTSVSSGGNGMDLSNSGKVALAENPHIKFVNSQRGYVKCTVGRDTWQTEFKVVPYVNKPGAPLLTRATYVVDRGKPGAVAV